jgi:hypothetical protein
MNKNVFVSTLLMRLSLYCCREHCVCTVCSDCLCPLCRQWTRVASWTFLASPHLYLPPVNNTTASPAGGPRYILLTWFHASLVLQHLGPVVQLFRQHLNKDMVAKVYSTLHCLIKTLGAENY